MNNEPINNFLHSKAEVIVLSTKKPDLYLRNGSRIISNELMFDRILVGASENPGIKVLITHPGDSREIHEEVVLPLISNLKKLFLTQLVKVKRRYGMERIEFWNGSTITIRHFEQETDFDALAGAEYDWVFVCYAKMYSVTELTLLGSLVRGLKEVPKCLHLLPYSLMSETPWRWEHVLEALDIPFDKCEIIAL